MARITGSYPDDLDLLIDGAVEAGVFGGKSDALREFVRPYTKDIKNERIATAVALYKREQITLGDAARLAEIAGRCVISSVNTALNPVSDSLTKTTQPTR